MDNTKTMTKERSEVKEGTFFELNKVGYLVVGIPATLIGCWAVVCLVVAAVKIGPVVLVSGLFSSFGG